MVDFPGMKPN
uniref:Uncharacterized protein n=1 Tax=Arundo donax TaxID=35708 RepID=A0A0A9B0M8_ARUDO